MSLFHLYGFIIGLAVVLASSLIEWKKKLEGIDFNFEKAFVFVFIPAVIGARFYHVLTDFAEYQHQLVQVLYVWNGGLSIMGGLVGGSIGLLIFSWHENIELRKLGDLVVFGLPFGQAIGRFGNWANQELYGYPTTLPWGIHIDEAHRLAAFQSFERYHPLFLYESILLLGLGIWLWLISFGRIKKKIPMLGSGWYLSFYFIWYGFVRFILEFLRIEKHMWGILSINQWMSIGIFLLGILLYRMKERHV